MSWTKRIFVAVTCTAIASACIVATGVGMGSTLPGNPVSVAVTPSKVIIRGIGGTTLLQAEARDSAGTIIPDLSFQWNAANPAIATVSQQGLVTSQGFGITNVTATALCGSTPCGGGSVSGSSEVTVEQVIGGLPNEPAGFTQITEHRGSPWPGDWWTWDPGSNISVLQDGAAPIGNWGTVRYRFRAGHAGGTGPGMMGHGEGNVGDSKNMKVNGQPVREIYVRIWLKYHNPWQQPTSGQSKIFYTYQRVTDSRNVLHPNITGTTAPFGTQVTSEVWTGSGAQVQNLNPNRENIRIQPGVWYLYELYARVSSGPGVHDGIVRWWIDGKLVGEHVNILRSHHPFTEFHGNPVWGGSSTIAVQQEQYLYFNGIYISGR